jgi:hypothetical protein
MTREITVPPCLTDRAAVDYYCRAMERHYAEQDGRYASGETRKGVFCDLGAEASALNVALQIQRHEEIPLANPEISKLLGLIR